MLWKVYSVTHGDRYIWPDSRKYETDGKCDRYHDHAVGNGPWVALWGHHEPRHRSYFTKRPHYAAPTLPGIKTSINNPDMSYSAVFILYPLSPQPELIKVTRRNYEDIYCCFRVASLVKNLMSLPCFKLAPQFILTFQEKFTYPNFENFKYAADFNLLYSTNYLASCSSFTIYSAVNT